MILLLHISIAIASLISAAVLYVSPSKSKLYTSYGLVAVTLFSGFYLVISKPAHLAQSCVMGLAYLAVVSYAIIFARRTLAIHQ